MTAGEAARCRWLLQFTLTSARQASSSSVADFICLSFRSVAGCEGVNAHRTRAEIDDLQQAADEHDVLEEMDHLVLIGEISMKGNGSRQRKQGNDKRDDRDNGNRNGRRTGKLSNLHLGALDAATGEYVMLGKTFKGLTDTLLAWQTEQFLAREIRRDEMTVYVRPELVVEIAFSDLQASVRYPGGLALRLARVKRYRDDKRAEEADDMGAVRRIYAAQSSASKD